MLSQDFKEFIQSLNANDVKYLLIGGYALAFHGCPRYTKDLDIWIEPSQTNAERIINALKDFGFGSLGLKPDDFTTSNQVIQLGYPPSRIDITTSADGVDFETSYAERVTALIEDTNITVIGIAQLKQNKAATARAQDLADLERLESLQD